MKNLNKNLVAFRKGFLVCPDDSQNNRVLVATINAELMKLGYILNEEAFNCLCKSNEKFIKVWAKDVIDFLTDFMGIDHTYKPLHSGFPESLMEMSDFEMYFKAILHYWSGGTLVYEDENIKKEYIFESCKFNPIACKSENDFLNIFKDLAQVNTALTPEDFSIIEWFAKIYGKFTMPKEIPFKENLCMLAALRLDVPVKTSTDVLRIAAYLSHGHSDLILPPNKIKESSWSRTLVSNPLRNDYKFKLTNSQKRYVLSLLEKVANSAEMKEKHKMWNKLAHCIHPTKYENKFPKAVKALRNMNSSTSDFTSIKTFNSKVENTDYTGKIELLKTRPGILARKLNELFIKYPQHHTEILNSFIEVGDKISNKVLFELYTYFQKRNEVNENRQIVVKGSRKATPLPTLVPLSGYLIDAVNKAIWTILFNKFAKLDPLGKVYLDEELKKIPCPTNMRTLNPSLKPTVRGQRVPLDVNKKVIRFYLFWTAGIDFDLSCTFLSKSGDKNYCSFRNMRPHPSVQHSGDLIPHSPGEYAEYIDIETDKVPYKYGLMTVCNFRGGKLSDAGVKCGFMERDTKTSGTAWLPKTVTNAFSVDIEAQNAALILIDFETKEWILVDMDLDGIPVATGKEFDNYVKQLAELPKVSAYDILKLHTEARGSIVTEIEDADVVFKYEDFSKEYSEIIKYML